MKISKAICKKWWKGQWRCLRLESTNMPCTSLYKHQIPESKAEKPWTPLSTKEGDLSFLYNTAEKSDILVFTFPVFLLGLSWTSSEGHHSKLKFSKKWWDIVSENPGLGIYAAIKHLSSKLRHWVYSSALRRNAGVFCHEKCVYRFLFSINTLLHTQWLHDHWKQEGSKHSVILKSFIFLKNGFN